MFGVLNRDSEILSGMDSNASCMYISGSTNLKHSFQYRRMYDKLKQLSSPNNAIFMIFLAVL